MDASTERVHYYADQIVQSQIQRCYIAPGIRVDPEYPNMHYLHYGLKAQNWQDVDAFERELMDLRLPDNEYDAIYQAWMCRQSLDCDAHSFWPRRQSIYAETAEQAIARTTILNEDNGIPIVRYTRRSSESRGISPLLVVGSAHAFPLSASEEDPFECDIPPIDGPSLSTSIPEEDGHADASSEGALPPHPQSSSTASSSEDETTDGDGDDSLWLPAPERTHVPNSSRQSTLSTSPNASPTKPEISLPVPKHGEQHIPRSQSPSVASSDASDDNYAEPHTLKRKARSAPKHSAKRTRSAPSPPISSSSSEPSTALALSSTTISFKSANPDCPPLPIEPNSRGKWSCPYAGCTHETSAFGDLLRHLESLAHQPDKKHRCATCGCTFTRVDALKRHQLKRPERCKMIARNAIKA